MNNKFEIGDEVEIINVGEYYSTYEGMAKKLKADKWKSSRKNPGNGKIGEVINYKAHSISSYGIVYLIEIDNKQYLFGESGLRLVEKKKLKDCKIEASKEKKKLTNRELFGI